MLTGLVDHDVERAVHGLGAIRLPVDVHRRVHEIGVVLEMARELVEPLAGDVGRVHELVAALEVLLLPELLDQVAHHAALGVPVDQPRSHLLVDREQIQLLAEPAVVALERLLDAEQMSFQLRQGRKRRAIDALQHFVALVAEPVRSRDVGELERLDAPGALEMRSAAQVEERAVAVIGHLGAGRDLGKKMELVLLSCRLEALLGFLARRLRVLEGLVRGHDLAHPRLDPLEVFGGERLGAREVVVETALDRRTARDLDLGKQLGDRGRQHVGRRVPQAVECLATRVLGDLGTILGSGGHGHGVALGRFYG